MASDIQILNVVAFDQNGLAVVHPRTAWKATYRKQQASIELKCGTHTQAYDLRTQVVAVGLGEATKKVALGKTLGRVALTGLFHGRYAAGADLRWGGIDRDEFQQIYLVMSDTSAVSLELDGEDAEDLVNMLPAAAREEDSRAQVEKLMARIKAMVADGERVLDELTGSRQALAAEREALQPKINHGSSFDERHAAKERDTQIGLQLAELATVQRAVLYDFSTIKVAKERQMRDAQKTVPASVAAAKAISNKPMPVPSKEPVHQPLHPAKKTTSIGRKLVNLVVWIVGAGAGIVFNVFLAMMFGVEGIWYLLAITIPLGGWLGLHMLAALMRR